MSPKEAAARVAVEDDPVLRALENAPLDDEPDTEEEIAALESLRAGGPTFSHAEVVARLELARPVEGD